MPDMLSDMRSNLSKMSASQDGRERLRAETIQNIKRYASGKEGFGTDVPGLSVAYMTSPVNGVMHLTESYFCICLSGARSLTIGSKNYRQQKYDYLLSAIDVPVIVSIDEATPQVPYSAVALELDFELGRRVAVDAEAPATPLDRRDDNWSVGDLDMEFLDCIARFVRLLDRPRDTKFMSEMLHREMWYLLLTSPSGNHLREVMRLDSQSHRVNKAIAWLRQHYRERLRVEDLAQIAGMGVSTLHRHFHQFTNMSPIQYQKQLRLHEARRLILEDDCEVGLAAMHVGYESSTQFIREYRRQFGAPPLRNVKDIRAIGRNYQLI